jgi:hypothetical protein
VLLGARLLGELGVVNENELAGLRELVLELSEPGRGLRDLGEPPVLSPELRQPVGVAKRLRVRE